MNYSKRDFLKVVACWTMLIMFSGCSSQQEPLRVGSHVWPGYEFMFLARNLNQLPPSQVSLLETTSASETLMRLRNDEIDAGALTLDEVLRARAEGLDLVVVLVFNISAGADMVISRSAIKTLKELRGKRIAVELNSVAEIVLGQLMAVSRLSTEDLQLEYMTIDQQLSAWQNGEIDAAVTYEPTASKLLNNGGQLLFSSQQMPEMIVDVLAVKRHALVKDKAIAALVNAHFAALEHFKVNHHDAVYRMSSRLKVAANDLDGLYKGLLLPDQSNNLRLLSRDGGVLHERVESLQQILRLNTGSMQQLSKDMIDDSFVSRRFGK